MIAKKLSEAKEYVAPNHRACSTLRLFGAEAGGSKALIAGVSHFLPGGGAGPDASPPEKVYYVLAGELTVIVNGKETVLKKNDSAPWATTMRRIDFCVMATSDTWNVMPTTKEK